MGNELLPCPFCGSAAFSTFKTEGPHSLQAHSVHCSAQCGGQVKGQHYSEAAAVTAWNTRATPAQQDAPTDAELLDFYLSHAGYEVKHSDVRVLHILRALLASYAPAQDAEQARDAERYRWLREQHWHSSKLFVVSGPVSLGTYCPSLVLLDAAIDAARALKSTSAGKGE